jgi:hypothetical protein
MVPGPAVSPDARIAATSPEVPCYQAYD